MLDVDAFYMAGDNWIFTNFYDILRCLLMLSILVINLEFINHFVKDLFECVLIKLKAKVLFNLAKSITKHHTKSY